MPLKKNQNPIGSDWNPQSTAWNPESKREIILDSFSWSIHGAINWRKKSPSLAVVVVFENLQRNSLYRAARFANLEEILGFSVPSIILVKAGLMQITMQRARPAWLRMTLDCPRKESDVALFLQVTRMRKIIKICKANLVHVHTYPEIFFPQIFFCGCENFRVHTQRIRIVFSRPHVSDCIRKFSDLL